MDHRQFEARPAPMRIELSRAALASDEPYCSVSEPNPSSPAPRLDGKFSLGERIDYRVSGKLTIEPKRVPTLSGLGSAPTADLHEESVREARLLQSRPLLMRAVHGSGYNAKLRTCSKPSSDSSRSSHVRVRGEREDQEELAIAVSHAAARDLIAGTQSYRICFVSESAYELWAGSTWLGVGTLGHTFASPSVRLKVCRVREQPEQHGVEYELELFPMHEVVAHVQRSLTVTLCPPRESAAPATEVSLSFCDESPTRARELLRQLVLAYLALRPERESTTAVIPAAPAPATAAPAMHAAPPGVGRRRPQAERTRGDVAPRATVRLPVPVRTQETLAPRSEPDLDLQAAARRFLPPRPSWGRWAAAAALAALLLGQGAIALGKREAGAKRATRPSSVSAAVEASLLNLPVASAAPSAVVPVPTVEPLHPREPSESTCSAPSSPVPVVRAIKKRALAIAPTQSQVEQREPAKNAFGPHDFEPSTEESGAMLDALPVNPY